MVVRATTTNEIPTQAEFIQPGNQAPGYASTGAGGPGTPRLMSFLSMLGAGGALGADVERYIETVRSYLPKDGASSACGPVKIQRLSEPNGAHAFIVDNKAIVLVFEELLPPADTQNFVPLSVHASVLSDVLKKEAGLGDPINVILVQREDYPRAQLMAMHLSLNLAFATNSRFSDETVGLLGGVEFVVDPNPDQFRSYIDKHSPHAVQGRMDYGFVLSARFNRRIAGMASVDDLKPIAAVGAYTEILRNGASDGMFAQPGQPQFVATVHITEIATEIPHSGIVPLLLAQAANMFIDQQRWLQPLMSFQKQKPNLGNLMIDPTDKNRLGFLNNRAELGEWLARNMMPRALLVVDVAEGRARIPALANYGNQTTYGKRVYEQIAGFFGNAVPLDTNRPSYYNLAQTFLGTWGDPKRGGALLDSRYLDYLELLANNGASGNAALLLQYPQDPTYRARLLSELSSGSFKSLWWTQLSIIDPVMLAGLASAVASRVRILGPSQQQQMVSTPYLPGLMQDYVANSFLTTAQPRAGFSGGGLVYNV